MHIHRYVALIFLLAAAAASAVAAISPSVSQRELDACIYFALLGILAQLLSHKIRQRTFGSIAFIPYLASALVAPSWPTVLVATVASALAEHTRRLGVLKTVFNTAQMSLAVSVAILVFRALGGSSLGRDSVALFPYIGSALAFFLTNTFAVSGAIAISERRAFFRAWSEITQGALLYDLLASPLPYIVAWVFVTHGPIWTAAFCLPLLAVRQVFKTNWQLEQVNQELLELMVAAIEARDPYTSGHSKRVAHYAQIVARAMGLKGKQLNRITTAALLHDVGKIHEEYAPILRKPDKLTVEERLIIETHPIKSAELVSKVSQLSDIVAPVRHHHENWDGTGYPDKLSAEQIPLAARIIMIADTVDAMTSDRPYRAALSEEDVRRELVAFSGKQFDPSIIKQLLESPLYAELFGTSTHAQMPRHAAPSLRKVG